jgi:hypothetical protein
MEPPTHNVSQKVFFFFGIIEAKKTTNIKPFDFASSHTSLFAR